MKHTCTHYSLQNTLSKTTKAIPESSTKESTNEGAHHVHRQQNTGNPATDSEHPAFTPGNPNPSLPHKYI